MAKGVISYVILLRGLDHLGPDTWGHIEMTITIHYVQLYRVNDHLLKIPLATVIKVN